MKQTTELRRRIAPSVPLTLELADDSGEKFTRSFLLAFDFNAMTSVLEQTGYSMLTGEIWNHVNEKTLSIMFHAAVLLRHPEYASDNGLEVIRSYMDTMNTEAITNALNDAFLLQLPPARRKKVEAAQKQALEQGENPTSPATAPTPDQAKPQAA
jgi:hypothetical protein